MNIRVRYVATKNGSELLDLSGIKRPIAHDPFGALVIAKGAGDGFSPSAPSILSDFSEACFDRGMLSQQIVAVSIACRCT